MFNVNLYQSTWNSWFRNSVDLICQIVCRMLSWEVMLKLRKHFMNTADFKIKIFDIVMNGKRVKLEQTMMGVMSVLNNEQSKVTC